jgi:hypothetical protein
MPIIGRIASSSMQTPATTIFAPRRLPHHVAQHARHADALEHGRRARSAPPRYAPSTDRSFRVDDDVRAHLRGEALAHRREVPGDDQVRRP